MKSSYRPTVNYLE